jgi:outer membrane receptor protein involved in Fe transport
VADLQLHAGLVGGVDARYVDSVYADNANSLKAPAYTLFGAFARYRVDAHTTLTARVRNLTDEVYAKQAYNTQYYMGTRGRLRWRWMCGSRGSSGMPKDWVKASRCMPEDLQRL